MRKMFKFEVRKSSNENFLVTALVVDNKVCVDNIFEVENMNFKFIESYYPNIENFSVYAVGADNINFGRAKKLSSMLNKAAQAI